MSSDLLTDIVAGVPYLDPRRGERGQVHGRRTSSPVSHRAPADLDVLVLTDPRTGLLAVLMHWAGRIRHERPVAGDSMRSVISEANLIAGHWDWAMRQPWAGAMLAELEALADRVHEVRYGVSVRPCPVCGEPVRLDRFSVDHRDCIGVSWSP